MLLLQHSLLTLCNRFAFLLKRFILISFLFLIAALAGQTQILPKGFNQVLVANGITNPTVMAFAPDGRLFVAEQTGALRIIKNGVLLSKPFITLRVNSRGERGLIGIAFDPAFSTNKHIFLYYTDSSGSNNRISRFTANGDIAVPGSEVVVLNLSPLSTATNHNGGNMLFGKDGKLYVGIGENAYSANAQNLDTYLGKVLRINSDGSVPAGNPFTTGSEERRRIWEYGLRNPYTLSVQPVTGRIFVNDVGQNTWEEVNDCTTGGHNYGWPLAEGMDSDSRFTNPVYTYKHGSGIGVGCAITGGTFFNPAKTNYPASYIGKYFFLDYCGRWIDMLSLTNTPAARSNFASSIAGSAVGLTAGPDGNLYFLSRGEDAVYKITYTASGAPVIDEQPVSITVSKGNAASFSVKASGTGTLKYQWRKNGVNISGATGATYTIAAAAYADSGTYSVVVSNSTASVTSKNATLKVTAPNQTPVATIKTPLKGATYAAGNTISFSGSATDAEDGTLPASTFTWFVLFHHDQHTHPGPSVPSGVTNGSFTIPDVGETSANVFYRLYLVVTDSKGTKDTSFTDILPRKSSITINTNPANLRITLDGQPFTAPLTVTSVEGMKRTIGAITPQGNYTFSNWSNGGDTLQTIATPVDDVTYTASFSKTITDIIVPVADAFVRAGMYTDSNFGAAAKLYSKQASIADYQREVFIRFDISSFSADVSSVVLRLYGALGTTENSSVPVEIHNVPDITWREAAITWRSKPAADNAILATKTIAGTAYKYYDWNVTAQIRNLRKAGVNFVTLKLINANTTLSPAEFNAKESKDNKPQLVVTYSSAANKQNNRLIVSDGTVENRIISLYPNPAKNSFNISIKNSAKASFIRIYDINGRLIKDIAVTNNKVQQIYAGDLENGVYLISVGNGKKLITKKLIIEK